MIVEFKKQNSTLSDTEMSESLASYPQFDVVGLIAQVGSEVWARVSVD